MHKAVAQNQESTHQTIVLEVKILSIDKRWGNGIHFGRWGQSKECQDADDARSVSAPAATIESAAATAIELAAAADASDAAAVAVLAACLSA